jgi:hypothetical protein
VCVCSRRAFITVCGQDQAKLRDLLQHIYTALELRAQQHYHEPVRLARL